MLYKGRVLTLQDRAGRMIVVRLNYKTVSGWICEVIGGFNILVFQEELEEALSLEYTDQPL